MKVQIYLRGKKADLEAVGIFDTVTKETTVLKGSRISEKVSCGKTFRGAASVAKQREGVVKDRIVTSDVHFKSPSTAANFVTGASTNGWKTWKDSNGKSIKESYAEVKHE